MDQDINKRLQELEEKVDLLLKSVEKVRKYFLAIIWITVIAFVLPLIGLLFAIPTFLDTYLTSLEGLL